MGPAPSVAESFGTAAKVKTRRVSGRPARTPTILQMEAVECGAAALAIVMAHHGVFVPLEELRKDCGVTRDGSKASSLVKAARRHGFEAHGWKREIDRLGELDFPLIAYWNFCHFLVVEGFDGDRVAINDPATGRRSVSWSEFDESYTGVVLTIRPTEKTTPRGAPPSLLRSLEKRTARPGFTFALILFAGALLAVPGLLAALVTEAFIDDILVAGKFDRQVLFLVGLAILAILQAALTLASRASLRALGARLDAEMSQGFLRHLLRLPIDFFAERRPTEIALRLDLNRAVADFISGPLGRAAVSPATMFVFGTAMVVYDPELAIVAGVLGVVGALALSLGRERRADLGTRAAVDRARAAVVGVSGLQAIETLKATALEGDFFRRWSGHEAKALNALSALLTTTRLRSALPIVLAGLSNALLLVLGGLRVIEGEFSIGMLVAFQGFAWSFYAPIAALVGLGSSFAEMRANLARLDDVLEAEPDPLAAVSIATSPASPLDPSRLSGKIEIRNITFGYAPHEAPLLEDLTLTIEPGRTVALVGASGSGKSTVVRLLAGLHRPWRGEVRFDGRAIEMIDRRLRSRSTAFVDQEIALFAGTIRENLTLWDDTVPSAWVIEACRDAAIHDDIVRLPDGYETEVLECGANFSGGQRQRLEIARALVGRPTIIVMDEPTSALDLATERRVLAGIRARGATMLVVAHRLSTIRSADEIVVLERGKIVQRGRHERLILDLEGEYARLVRSEGPDRGACHD